ncbi:cation:proton antiporter [Peptacetobacter sp.]|uniref:cation:proton antiporter n=1 Tax=Peptacetobacter sp. TaxID=2991975 RepID=UPI0026074D11|nr:cation:proton antiporter [Peptacetobacter sp.]
MLTSLALIFLVGLSLASICEKLKLPRIIGMLITGVILGPYVLNLFDESILGISSELRKIALIIIIIKAGLSLDLKDLKKVGRPALLMSFLPASFELLAYVVFAPYLLGISKLEAALMGAVLSAVSPAIVVPRMVNLIETNSGTKKGIPQMILAGASFDDIFVIVLFTTFLSMNQGESVSFMSFANIPISVISGITLGAIVGFLLYKFFETRYINEHLVRNSIKTIIILAISFLLISLETFLEGKLAMSGLLAVMSMSLVIALKSTNIVKVRLQEKFGKLWLAAEVILFVLVGAAVDIRYTMEAGIMAIVMIFIALIIRSIGVFICTIKTNLSNKERFFCVLSYLPKATVQAAIGSVPLASGLPCGKIILSVAVLAIIITAPLGAFAMDISAKKFLD